MSFQFAFVSEQLECPDIEGLETINGRPLTSLEGVSIVSDNTNINEPVLFTNVDIPSRTSTLQTNDKFYANPGTGQLGANHFANLSVPTTYSSTPETITAASLFQNLIENTNSGATTWNLDSTVNIINTYHLTDLDRTVSVSVTNTTGTITLVAGDVDTTLVSCPPQSASFTILISLSGAGTLNVNIVGAGVVGGAAPLITSNTFLSTPDTITAASLLGGLITNTASGQTTWTFDTTANIIATLGLVTIGQTVLASACNNNNFITLNAADGGTSIIGRFQLQSFTMYIQLSGVGAITIYVVGAGGGGMTLNTSHLSARDLILFTNISSPGTINGVLSNPLLYFVPSTGQLNSASFVSKTATVSYAGSSAVAASDLVGGSLINTGAGSVSLTLDTTANIIAAFGFDNVGQTAVVYVCNNATAAITIVAGDGSTTVYNNPQNGSFPLVIQYAGSGLLNVYA